MGASCPQIFWLSLIFLMHPMRWSMLILFTGPSNLLVMQSATLSRASMALKNARTASHWCLVETNKIMVSGPWWWHVTWKWNTWEKQSHHVSPPATTYYLGFCPLEWSRCRSRQGRSCLWKLVESELWFLFMMSWLLFNYLLLASITPLNFIMVSMFVKHVVAIVVPLLQEVLCNPLR